MNTNAKNLIVSFSGYGLAPVSFRHPFSVATVVPTCKQTANNNDSYNGVLFSARPGKEQTIIQFKKDIASPFHRDPFTKQRLPVKLGRIKNSEIEDLKRSSLPACLDMPIKLTGSNTIVLPPPYKNNSAIQAILKKVLSFEKEQNPNWEDYYLYLTVDTRTVERGKSQRIGGWHFDGMQGEQYPIKLPACHSYLFSTAIPTEFNYTAAKNVEHLSEKKHNWYKILAKQLIKSKTVQAKINTLYAMTAYQIHRSVKASKDTPRVFIRFEFSQKKFDREGNTVNPDLVTGFEYRERPFAFKRKNKPDSPWKGTPIFNKTA